MMMGAVFVMKLLYRSINIKLKYRHISIKLVGILADIQLSVIVIINDAINFDVI